MIFWSREAALLEASDCELIDVTCNQIQGRSKLSGLPFDQRDLECGVQEVFNLVIGKRGGMVLRCKQVWAPIFECVACSF